MFQQRVSVMRFFAALVDAFASFVQRNPLFVLCVVILALVAPALLKGIAAFILYLFLGLVLLVGILAFLFRWRLYRLRRDLEGQFRGFGPGAGDPFARTRQYAREGNVEVRKTTATPEKRVSDDVGDYVEFEETTDSQNDQ